MKTILVTGASGFLGKQISKYFNKYHLNEFKLLGIARHAVSEGFTRMYCADLTNLQSVKDLIKQMDAENFNIDVLVHCASEMAGKENIKGIELFDKNLQITRSIIEIIKEIKTYKLINFSSIAVYPDIDGEYDENSLINPSLNGDGLYGLSKFVAENLFDLQLKDYCPTITHLRIAHVYGEGMREDRIYPKMKLEMLKNNRITVWGKGERVMNFISVNRLVQLVDFFCSKDFPGVYNIGEKNCTIQELAGQLAKEFNMRPEVVYIDKGVKSKIRINCEKLNKIINNKQ